MVKNLKSQTCARSFLQHSTLNAHETADSIMTLIAGEIIQEPLLALRKEFIFEVLEEIVNLGEQGISELLLSPLW